MKITTTIEWNETETLWITGYYEEAVPMSEDMIDPPIPSSFEIISIRYNGMDVENLFDDNQFYKIMEECIKTIEDRL